MFCGSQIQVVPSLLISDDSLSALTICQLTQVYLSGFPTLWLALYRALWESTRSKNQFFALKINKEEAETISKFSGVLVMFQFAHFSEV